MAELYAHGAAAALPSKSNRKITRDHNEDMHKWRHRIENCFPNIKEFRAIATRCDKTVAGFRALIDLVAGVIAARQIRANRDHWSTGPSIAIKNLARKSQYRVCYIQCEDKKGLLIRRNRKANETLQPMIA